MEKYGFIYIWYDRKHKRFYVGAHWGSEDDGYVCSSTWMKIAYNRRPEDFRRRILHRFYSSKREMFDEENRILNLINEDELGKRYYNMQNKWRHWSSKDNDMSVREKLSENHRSRNGMTNKGKTYKPQKQDSKSRLTGAERTDKQKEANRLKSEKQKGAISPKLGKKYGPHKNPRKKGYKIVGRKHSKPAWNKGINHSDAKDRNSICQAP